LQNPNEKLLNELLASAETREDLETVLGLLAEQEVAEENRDRFLLHTLSEVADMFGVDEHTVRVWRLKTPPMPGEPGKWPLKEIIHWRCNWIQQTDLAAAKRQQDFDLGQLQVESKRLELEREKQQILNREDVELWAATALIELREGVMQLPELLAAIVSQELKDFIRAEADRHCRDLLLATQRRLELAEIGRGERES
jgi:hypothetical protein